MTDQHCGNCAFDGLLSGNCYFPKPQDGTEPPFMVTAAMPDKSSDGENCVQWRKNAKRGKP